MKILSRGVVCAGAIFGLVALAGCSSGSTKAGSSGAGASFEANGKSEISSATNEVSGSPEALDADASDGQAAMGAGASNGSVAGKLDKKYEALGKAVRSARANSILAEASKILGTNQFDPTALNALAMYHFRKGRPGAAKLLLNRALEKNTNSAALLNNYGVVLLEEDDAQGAVVNFKKALHADPNHPQALGNLGSIYVESGDYSRALPLLESAYRQLRTSAPGVATNYAIALRASRDFANAQRIYEEVLKVNSRDVATLLDYAILDIDYMSKPKEGLALVYKVKFIETDRKDILDRASALEIKAKAGLK